MVVTNTSDVWSAAGTVFIVVGLSALTVMGVWEHDARQEEHRIVEALIRSENESVRKRMDLVICTTQLNLFVQTIPKGQKITWQDVPRELWVCMPKALVEERKQ